MAFNMAVGKPEENQDGGQKTEVVKLWLETRYRRGSNAYTHIFDVGRSNAA
jgi:hypothetical protein